MSPMNIDEAKIRLDKAIRDFTIAHFANSGNYYRTRAGVKGQITRFEGKALGEIAEVHYIETGEVLSCKGKTKLEPEAIQKILDNLSQV